MEVTLHNQASEIRRVHDALDEIAARFSAAPRAAERLHLALEEHLSNVISYGYRPGETGSISVRFQASASVLRVEVEDDGQPFDPTAAPRVDVSVPLDQKPIGGLGIHMIRRSVDEWEYRRERGHNLLILKQRIEAAGTATDGAA